MKKLWILSPGLLLTLALTSCGKGPEAPSSTEESSPDESTTSSSISSPIISGGGEINVKSFETALNADYSNVQVAYTQVYGDGSFAETAYEFYGDGYLLVDDYTAAESAYTGWYRYSLYHEYEGDWYTYWDAEQQHYEHSGWISNGYRGADLAPYHAYFTIPHLLEALTADDVELLYGIYYVKDDRVEDIVSRAFEFYGDPFMSVSDITSIGFLLDEEGRFSKILASVSADSDDGVLLEFGYYGETSFPFELPAAPDGSNIYTYAEMLGDAYVPDVYADEIHLRVTDSSSLDVTLTLDDSIDVYYEVAPENTNRFDVEWVSTDPNVAVVDYKSNPTSHHKFVTGVGIGTAEIYCRYRLEDGTYLESEHLKVTVNGIKDQNKEGAVYDFVISGHEDVQKEDGSFDHTDIFATNLLGGTAPFSIVSHNVRTLEAKNTDSFGKDGFVLYATPSNGEFMNKGFYSEVLFDFGDQQVSDLSFHYALHRSSQRGDALSALSEAYIATSNDGKTWSEPISMKDEMLSEFRKINVDYAANQKLLERSFAPASKVKIYFKASVVGKNIGLCMDDFVFLASEECHDHEDAVLVPVESVTLSAPTTKLKVGETLQLSSSVLPAEASDKTLSYRVSDSSLATVSASGLVTALGEGEVEIVAVASNGVESSPVTLTLYSQEELPESALGTYLTDEVYASGSWYEVKLEVASLTAATLTLTPESGEPLVIPFAYDHLESDSVAPHVFLSGAWTLKVKFSSDGAEIFLSGGSIELGNTHTNVGESLTRYVASSSIVAKKSGTTITSVSLKVGESSSFTASVLPSSAYHQDVTARVLDETVATVAKTEGSNYFTVTALKAGSTYVVLENADGVTLSLPVTVSAPVTLTALSLSASKTSIDIGGSATITPNLTPSNVDSLSLSYSSSDASVASVKKNADGTATVSALKAGNVTITCVDSVSGLSATIDLTVNATQAAIPSTLVGTFDGTDEISNSMILTIREDGTGSLTCDDAGLDTSFTLSSSDGSTYVFACDIGYDLEISTNGSVLFVTLAGGEYLDEYGVMVANTNFYRM